MINKRILYNMKKRHGEEIYHFLVDNNNYRGAIKLQCAIKTFNNKLVIDGRVGPRTLSMLTKYFHQPNFIEIFHRKLNITMKDYIMIYLAIEEGEHIHFNPTEKTFTTPYGVYAYYHRRSTPVNFIRKLASARGFPTITRQNYKRVDSIISDKERATIRDLAYTFYMEDYLDKKLFTEMERLGYIKTLLSTLSIAVNAHPKTSNILLQRALKVKTDGVVGPITLSHIKRHTDEKLNSKFLEYAERFYLGLNMKRYINGYLNRVKNLK